MRYQYGARITVVAPGGNAVTGQIGEMTRHGPVIHLPTFQMEVPADVLRHEGWQVPELDSAEEPAVHSYALEGTKIVDALLNADEKDSALQGAANGPRRLGVPDHAVGRDPDRRAKRAHCQVCGSYAHPTEKCPMQGQPII